jgi:hypothetical protein
VLSKNPAPPLSTQHSALSTAAVAIFLAARLPLLFGRDFFFDELFTRWIASKSLTDIVRALRYDSGPPLYYWLIQLLGNPPLVWVRGLSLLFSLVALIALLRKGHQLAALFVAVFPPAVLFAVDARSYALCAMLVTLAIVVMPSESEASGGEGGALNLPQRATRPSSSLARARGDMLAALFLVLAAYSHYYGVLFFPLLLRKPKALLLAIVLFAPGFWMAAVQPKEARAWMTMEWPDALFIRPPLLLAGVIAIALLACLRANRFAIITLVPLALALVMSVYVPMRFDAVIAAPLALWIASPRRKWLPASAIAACAIWTAIGVADHLRRPPDPYREAARFVEAHAGSNPVVASGYLYLETVVLRPATALPPEQALHPGWRATANAGVSLPEGPFWWVGERGAPELELIRRARAVRPLFVNSRAAVVAVH